MSIDERPSDNNATPLKQDGRLLNWYRPSVDLFKSAIWPITVLFIFLSIKAPLLSSLAELPAVIQSTQKVTIGTVSIERRLRDAGIPADIRRALAKLSKNGLILLLDTGKLGFGYLDADWETENSNAATLRELQKEELIIIAKADPDEKYPVRYSLSPPARNAYEILLKSVIAQLAEDTVAGGKQ